MLQRIRFLTVCLGAICVTGNFIFAQTEAPTIPATEAVWTLTNIEVKESTSVIPDIASPDFVGVVKGLPSLFIDGLAEDKDGGIWIVHHGLSRLVGDQLTTYSLQCQGQEISFVHPPVSGKSEMWFLPQSNGPVICQPVADGLEWRQYQNVADDSNGLAGIVSAIYEDTQGNIWWGGFRNSIWRVRDRRVALMYRSAKGWSSIFAITESPTGSILFGLSDGAFLVYDPYERWFIEEMRLSVLYRIGQIASICFDSLGNLYIGSRENGAVRVEGILTTRSLISRNSSGFADPRSFVNLDRNRNIWLCSDTQAICIHAPEYDTQTEYQFPDDVLVRQVLVDSKGVYWAATSRGLLKNFHKMPDVTAEEYGLPEEIRRIPKRASAPEEAEQPVR